MFILNLNQNRNSNQVLNNISSSWLYFSLFNYIQNYKISPCSQKEINKRYRTLAKELHPDHNKAEDAHEQFEMLVAAYEVEFLEFLYYISAIVYSHHT